MYKSFYLLAIAAALLLAGCAKKDESGSTASTTGGSTSSGASKGGESTTAPAVKEGWKEIKGTGYTLSIPKEWTPMDLTAENIDAMIEAAAKENEGIAMGKANFKQLATGGMVKFMAFGEVDKTGPFAENLNIVMNDAPAEPTIEMLEAGYKQGINAMLAPGATPSGGPVDLPVGKGIKMKSELAMGGTNRVASLAYMFSKGKTIYTVTFSSLTGRGAEMEKLADEVMQTFRTE